MLNRKVVEYKINGQTKYAIRKMSIFHLGYQYKDLRHGEYWWSSSDEYFKSCLGTKEEVLRVLIEKKNVMSVKEFMTKHLKTEEEKLEDDKLDRLGVDHE